MNKPFSFKFSEYSSLPQELSHQVEDLDKLCFHHHFTPTDQQDADGHDKFCSNGDLIYFVLASEKDQIIGETRVFKRTIAFDGQKIVLGGIGSVATHPDKRQKGVAKTMIARGMELLKKEVCDIAYLCTNIHDEKLVHLYKQFGFVILEKPHTYFGKSGKRYTDTDGMIAPVNSQEKFERALKNETPLDIGLGNW